MCIVKPISKTLNTRSHLNNQMEQRVEIRYQLMSTLLKSGQHGPLVKLLILNSIVDPVSVHDQNRIRATLKLNRYESYSLCISNSFSAPLIVPTPNGAQRLNARNLAVLGRLELLAVVKSKAIVTTLLLHVLQPAVSKDVNFSMIFYLYKYNNSMFLDMCFLFRIVHRQWVLVVFFSERAKDLCILAFFLVELALLLGGGVLVLLILGYEIVHVGLGLSELHLVHTLT